MTRCILPLVLVACSWAQGHGRVYTAPCRHIGVNAASEASPAGFGGVGATLQFTSDDPVCRIVYPPKDHP